MLDLAQFKPSDEPVAFEAVHPVTRAPLGVTIMLHGSDSEVYRNIQSTLQSKRLARFSPGKTRLTSAELEEDTLAVLAACTTGWKNVTWEGKPLTFSADNAKMLYKNLPWLREQVDAFVADRENFMKASSTS